MLPFTHVHPLELLELEELEPPEVVGVHVYEVVQFTPVPFPSQHSNVPLIHTAP